MKVKNIKNVSNERVLVRTADDMEINLPPNTDWDDLDVTNLDKLGEKVKYIADLTEVGNTGSKMQRLCD